MVAQILLGVIALAGIGALLVRERLAQTERAGFGFERDAWTRERAELLNRIQAPARQVYVPPAPVALTLVPDAPAAEFSEADGSWAVGLDTSLAPDPVNA